MRRKEREIVCKDEVLDVLRRCHTIRIAMNGEPFPYVVPVSFGMEIAEGNAVLYFHCAKEGKKLEMLQADQNVCVEADIYLGTEKTGHGITARYESVIGFGRCSLVTDISEAIHGLKLLTEHYGYYDYLLERCADMSKLLVGKIVLFELTGKRNKPV